MTDRGSPPSIAVDGAGADDPLPQADHYLSTMPIRAPDRRDGSRQPPAEVIEAAAESLRYRDFLTVVLIVDRAETFPDNLDLCP